MTTLADASKKWGIRTPKAVPHWKDRVTAVGRDNLKAGVADFLGVSEGEISGSRLDNYEDGIGLVSEADMRTAVEGKEDKYAKNLKEAWLAA